jgi:hypothetical protein
LVRMCAWRLRESARCCTSRATWNMDSVKPAAPSPQWACAQRIVSSWQNVHFLPCHKPPYSPYMSASDFLRCP